MTTQKEIVILKTSLKIYRLYHVFPPKGIELNPGPRFYLKFVVLALISSVTLIGSILHMIHTIKGKPQIYLSF